MPCKSRVDVVFLDISFMTLTELENQLPVDYRLSQIFEFMNYIYVFLSFYDMTAGSFSKSQTLLW